MSRLKVYFFFLLLNFTFIYAYGQHHQVKYNTKKIDQGLVYATLCDGPHPQVNVLERLLLKSLRSDQDQDKILDLIYYISEIMYFSSGYIAIRFLSSLSITQWE